MSNSILQVAGTSTALTISLASIANGAGRISTQVDNTVVQAGRIGIYCRIKSQNAPTDSTTYRFYLIRSDNNASAYVSEGLGVTDAAVATEPNNAQYIGSIVLTASATTSFYGDFIVNDPGPKWSVCFMNGSGQTITATGTDHYVRYVTLIDTIT